MEALILTLPTIILLAIPMPLLAFVAMELAEILSRVESRKKEKVKTKNGENGLFIR